MKNVKLKDEIGAEYYLWNDNGKRSYTAAGVAKHVRLALARTFPGVKFSVRSKNYAGGCSVDVDWTDGPTTAAVKAVTELYEGAGFDGMTDYKYYKGAWLNPKTLETGRLSNEYEGLKAELPAGAVAVDWAGCWLMEQRLLSAAGCRVILEGLDEKYSGGFGCNGRVYYASDLKVIENQDGSAYIDKSGWAWNLGPRLNQFINEFDLYTI